MSKTTTQPFPPMPFGSYQGVKIDELSHNYLVWALKNLCDPVPPKYPWLKTALECALDGEPYRGPDPEPQGGFMNGNSSDQFTPQTNEYKNYCSNHMKGGNWFPIWKEHLLRFGLAQAVVLSHLLSVGRVNSVGKGWLPYSPYFCEDSTSLEGEAQENALAALAEQGVIEIQQRGNKRYCRVVFEALEEKGPE